MQAGLSSIASGIDGDKTVSRSTFEDRSDAQDVVSGEASPTLTDMIGNVELGANGEAGIVVAATVVGYVPPAGLMVQVSLEPAEDKSVEAIEIRQDEAERATRGLPPDAPGPMAQAVRQADDLSDAEQAQVREMQARDASVRREEQAHAAAAGAMAGPIQYEYRTGPDGRRYVANGSVSIRDAAPAGDPVAAARMGRKLAAAAMSAQAPSAADFAAAAEGYRVAGAAERATVDDTARTPLAMAV